MLRWMIACLLCLIIAVPLYAQDDTLTPYEIALQRIEEARINDAATLYLRNLGLTELPPEIGQLTNLQWLDLKHNYLITLPVEIGQLSNLQVLWLSNNQFTTLPPEIGQLSNLRWLSITRNHLTTLPSEIDQLNHLCGLDLRFNNLQHLSVALSSLNSLTYDCQYNPPLGDGIFLDGNPLISPPPEVVEQGTVAVLAYLRNQAWYHTQRLIISAAGGVGLFVLLLLGFRWKQRGGRKSKRG